MKLEAMSKDKKVLKIDGNWKGNETTDAVLGYIIDAKKVFPVEIKIERSAETGKIAKVSFIEAPNEVKEGKSEDKKSEDKIRMARTSGLYIAMEHLKAVGKKDFSIQDVIRIAKEYTKYIENGEEEEFVPAEEIVEAKP